MSGVGGEERERDRTCLDRLHRTKLSREVRPIVVDRIHPDFREEGSRSLVVGCCTVACGGAAEEGQVDESWLRVGVRVGTAIEREELEWVSRESSSCYYRREACKSE